MVALSSRPPGCPLWVRAGDLNGDFKRAPACRPVPNVIVAFFGGCTVLQAETVSSLKIL
jgi:hypothetical protein